MLFSLFVAFSLLGISFASGGTEEVNRFVDTVLFNELPGEIKYNNQDPYKLPDFQTQFKDKLGLITVKVKTDYYEGLLNGFGKCKRARDCSTVYFYNGENRINCTLEFNDLSLEYRGKTKYGKMPKVSIKAKANLDTVYLAVEIASYDRGNAPYVRKMSITNQIKFTPEFTGLSVANSWLKGLESTFTGPVIDSITGAFNNEFRTSLDRVTKKFVLPI